MGLPDGCQRCPSIMVGRARQSREPSVTMARGKEEEYPHSGCSPHFSTLRSPGYVTVSLYIGHVPLSLVNSPGDTFTGSLKGALEISLSFLNSMKGTVKINHHNLYLVGTPS